MGDWWHDPCWCRRRTHFRPNSAINNRSIHNYRNWHWPSDYFLAFKKLGIKSNLVAIEKKRQDLDILALFTLYTLENLISNRSNYNTSEFNRTMIPLN